MRFPDLATMAEPDGIMRPGIVHRLDKDTSGVMVVARTPFARAALARQFKDRTVRKFYVAIVHGKMASDRRTIDRPIGRHPTERKRMSIRSYTPRAAISHVAVLCRLDDASVVGVRPETGRTHQIRVHLASIGHPCLDDPLYGRRSAEAAIGRQALHAFRLELDDPRSGQRLAFEAPLSEDFADYMSERGVSGLKESIVAWIKAEGTTKALPHVSIR
jgi:23S rRNA pseudouridine1911/1915/1917 synthase